MHDAEPDAGDRQSADRNPQPTVGVIGAGMSGLAVTHYLRAGGADVRTFEATDRPGGVLRSKSIAGTVLEYGPQRLRLSPTVESLIETFELDETLRTGHDGQPLFAYYDDALRPMPISRETAIETDLLSWRGKARVLLEPLTRGPRPGETVQEFLVRKFGHEAATRFMGPLYSGLYGTDAEDMFVEYSLGRALDHVGIQRSILWFVAKRLFEGVDKPPIVTFEDGLQSLPYAIYERYADRIHLNTPVTGLERTGDRFDVATDEDVYTFDEIVVTTPAPTAAELLTDVDETTAATLDRFNYNPVGVVHLESEFDGTGHGFHIIDDGFLTNGSTWNHSMLDREGVYTSFVDSNGISTGDSELDAIGERAAEEFETITGSPATVIGTAVVEPGMPAYDRSWRALDELSTPDGIAICSSYTSRAGITGRIVDGKRTAKTILSTDDAGHDPRST